LQEVEAPTLLRHTANRWLQGMNSSYNFEIVCRSILTQLTEGDTEILEIQDFVRDTLTKTCLFTKGNSSLMDKLTGFKLAIWTQSQNESDTGTISKCKPSRG
jgi:hypothetical protein